MNIMKEETFGPVLAVMKIDSDEEGVQLTNDSNLGLTSSVWSGNTKKAGKLAKQIEAGAVTLNDHLMSHGMSETPWGGFKESSIGRSHGEPGLQEMTQPKVIIHDRLHFLPVNIWWHPYSRNIYDGLSGALDAFYDKNLFVRMKGYSEDRRALYEQDFQKLNCPALLKRDKTPLFDIPHFIGKLSYSPSRACHFDKIIGNAAILHICTHRRIMNSEHCMGIGRA